MPDRVVVFIDAQNMYKGARDAFFEPHDYPTYGQFDPLRMGQLLMASGKVGANRNLVEVRIYTGRPDATRDPKTYAAHMKQCSAWAKSGVTVIPRTLRYPRDWPRERAQEKGIDVALSMDFFAMARDDKYNIGILVSTDTDMKPPLEEVVALNDPSKTVEVAAWRSARVRSRLGISGRNIWCHWLDFIKYNYLADPTNYAR